MRVFITGVSSGIGQRLAMILVSEGHEVWGVARRPMDSVSFRYSQCDVADSEQVKGVIREMEQADFLPDVVVLNSAIFERDLDNAFDYQAFKRALAVNFFGALVWVNEFLPKFLRRGRGKFVAVSSTSAWRPYEKGASLPASKAALSMAFRSLRLRYTRNNIRFSTVYFGPVATPAVPEFTLDSGKKRYFFVLSAEAAAGKLKKAIFGNKDEYYFPFWLTLLFRLTLIFPDKWFSSISTHLKK